MILAQSPLKLYKYRGKSCQAMLVNEKIEDYCGAEHFLYYASLADLTLRYREKCTARVRSERR